MENTIYENVLFASFVAMYAYGLFSFFTLSPEGKEYNNYRVSRRAFGTTMIIWASYLVVHWLFNMRANDPLLASSLCMSCYFPGIMLFEVTFSSLVDGNYPVRKRLRTITKYAIVINAVIFTNYFFVDDSIQEIVITATAIAFAIEMVILSRKFLTKYRDALKLADNYYSDNIDIFIKWMPNSIYIAIIFGFAGSVLAFATNSAVAIYMFGGLVLFTYIFISYQNYMINITKMKEILIPTDTEEQAIASEEISDEATVEFANTDEKEESKRIENNIEKWIAKNGFTQKGITIEELAVKLSTNRTYLSTYINTTYRLSFREWIGMHRMEYAKKLMLDNQEMPSNKIAEKVGYSPNAFTTIFTKSERISPTQWRSKHNK